MLEVIGFAFIFSFGFVAGAYYKGCAFDGQDWQILKWDTISLGYRPVSVGSSLRREDKILMALHLNSADFPKEGIQYAVDE